MTHGHAHDLGPTARGGDERRRLAWALAFTTTILLVEIAGGLVSGSLALLSDAGHMLVDSLSLLLSYVALRLADRPATARYTFGLRRVEILAAFLNGLTLLVVCAFIAYEGVQRLLHPVKVDTIVMLGVALVGIAANIASAVLLRHSHSLNARSAFLHVVGDLMSSAGIVVAGCVMLLWDAPWLDPALSIAIAVVVLVSAYRLTREAAGILLEAAPKDADTSAIRARLTAYPWVADVHDLHLWTITSGLHSMSCHVIVRTDEAPGADEALALLADLLRKEFGIGHSTIQFESTNYNGTHDPCFHC
jgi:cobalt-zinc-cadmium efflux system protein